MSRPSAVRVAVSEKDGDRVERRNLTGAVLVQHWIEPVSHSEESWRAASSLGAAATDAMRATTGRMAEKRINILISERGCVSRVKVAMGC